MFAINKYSSWGGGDLYNHYKDTVSEEEKKKREEGGGGRREREREREREKEQANKQNKTNQQTNNKITKRKADILMDIKCSPEVCTCSLRTFT